MQSPGPSSCKNKAPSASVSRDRKAPLRVLHVFAALDRGGAETWLMDVVRNTARHELQVDVCVTKNIKGAYEEEFKGLGGVVQRCPLGRNVWGFAARFERLLAAGHYDVVHSHLYYFSGLILRSAARAGVPQRIAHNHPAEDVKAGRLLRVPYVWLMRAWMRRYGTAFVGPTKASLEGFWGPGWDDDPAKRVIYNGIRVERFEKPVDRSQVRNELRLPTNGALVLNVSRFAPHKRHAFLVDVAERLVTHRDDVYFLLIGAGPLRESVETRVREKGLASRFRFIGGLPSLDRHWLSADVFAFPSCNEGFGIVIVEASAAGLRVVAQDIPGVREAADACIEPTLLPLDTPVDEWARALADTLARPRISETRRQTLLRNFPFTVNASIEALKELYGL